jgi:hypothetical protein
MGFSVVSGAEVLGTRRDWYSRRASLVKTLFTGNNSWEWEM